MNKEWIGSFLDRVISEDIGDGDHTSLATIPAGQRGKARLLVKENGILCGVKIAAEVFKRFDPAAALDLKIADGSEIKTGDIAFVVSSDVHALLAAERLVLNIMQRMSGIATQTRRYVKELDGLKTKVLDTRKTTPGMRYLDKYAVACGGGGNHRHGLYDMILIKDNHIDFAGGIRQAIERTHQYLSRKQKSLNIEVEARSFADIEEIMNIGGIHRIMLDNFSVEDTLKAVKMIDGRFETESSGGITIDNMRSYAECGVDFISIGALTHQIKSLDLSLKAL